MPLRGPRQTSDMDPAGPMHPRSPRGYHTPLKGGRARRGGDRVGPLLAAGSAGRTGTPPPPQARKHPIKQSSSAHPALLIAKGVVLKGEGRGLSSQGHGVRFWAWAAPWPSPRPRPGHAPSPAQCQALRRRRCAASWSQALTLLAQGSCL